VKGSGLGLVKTIMDGLGKITNNLNQDCRPTCRGSKLGFHEDEGDVLPTQPLRWIHFDIRLLFIFLQANDSQ
jgi:hypothetical protein